MKKAEAHKEEESKKAEALKLRAEADEEAEKSDEETENEADDDDDALQLPAGKYDKQGDVMVGDEVASDEAELINRPVVVVHHGENRDGCESDGMLTICDKYIDAYKFALSRIDLVNHKWALVHTILCMFPLEEYGKTHVPPEAQHVGRRGHLGP